MKFRSQGQKFSGTSFSRHQIQGEMQEEFQHGLFLLLFGCGTKLDTSTKDSLSWQVEFK